MIKTARCKFTVQKVEGDPASGNGAVIEMITQYDEALTKEDRAFSIYTPWGEMKFNVANKALAGFFEAGKAYYVDITPTE
ncbi:MAG TPA: hypothetical protein VNA25_22715 [Phycisphaerae bacterium]|nr:hypothetical protein [Phycisphaerae bacterium]